MDKDLKKYHEMSPFEIKDFLISLAVESFNKNAKKRDKFLNAGRGNPNFFNTLVREAFNYFSLFAVHIADASSSFDNIAFRYSKDDIYDKFLEYLSRQNQTEALIFLKKSIDFAIKEFKFDADEFIYELADGALGDFYPVPPRIFPHVEEITIKYLAEILCPDKTLPKGKYNVFATEGATAAMIYIFNSLKYNKIINEKDKIAIFTPIFSPYLEIPMLKEFNLTQVKIEGDEFNNWQISDKELNKLLDPSIKALFLVNPTNPTSVAVNEETIYKIADLVKKSRKDLIVITDTVYSTFVENFHSLVKEIPGNAICVYSFSKYFGVTGWRLGVIMMHEDSIVDSLLKKLKEKDKKEVDKRYSTITPEPRKIKFIDRLAMDSRDSALAHTGGLSCPQQIIMAFFCLFDLMDKEKKYKKDIRSILKKRIKNLYENLELPLPDEEGNAYYYSLINIAEVAKIKYGDKFKNYLIQKEDILKFLFRLAKEKYIVCLPGEGFAGPTWSIRISLANLEVEDYIKIGKSISELLLQYYKEFKKTKS
jgi:aspartate 4-decarboxylase